MTTKAFRVSHRLLWGLMLAGRAFGKFEVLLRVIRSARFAVVRVDGVYAGTDSSEPLCQEEIIGIMGGTSLTESLLQIIDGLYVWLDRYAMIIAKRAKIMAVSDDEKVQLMRITELLPALQDYRQGVSLDFWMLIGRALEATMRSWLPVAVIQKPQVVVIHDDLLILKSYGHDEVLTEERAFELLEATSPEEVSSRIADAIAVQLAELNLELRGLVDRRVRSEPGEELLEMRVVRAAGALSALGPHTNGGFPFTKELQEAYLHRTVPLSCELEGIAA